MFIHFKNIFEFFLTDLDFVENWKFGFWFFYRWFICYSRRSCLYKALSFGKNHWFTEKASFIYFRSCPFVFLAFKVGLIILLAVQSYVNTISNFTSFEQVCAWRSKKKKVMWNIGAVKKLFYNCCIRWSKSNPLNVSLQKGVLRVSSKFTGKHTCQNVISIKLKNVFLKLHFCIDVLL